METMRSQTFVCHSIVVQEIERKKDRERENLIDMALACSKNRKTAFYFSSFSKLSTEINDNGVKKEVERKKERKKETVAI